MGKNHKTKIVFENWWKNFIFITFWRQMVNVLNNSKNSKGSVRFGKKVSDTRLFGILDVIAIKNQHNLQGIQYEKVELILEVPFNLFFFCWLWIKFYSYGIRPTCKYIYTVTDSTTEAREK